MISNAYKRHGKTVVDATEPLVLNVTPNDRRKAIVGDDHNCAIAQCLKRRPEVVAVSVGANIVLVEHSEGLWVRYQLRAEDRRTIQAFDRVNYFRPGQYVLLPPKPSTRIGARSGEKPGSNTRTSQTKSVTNTPPTRHLSAPA